MTEICPVCGWSYLRTEHMAENPDPDHGPNAPGTLYVHKWEATGNGRAVIEGCSEYDDGETDSWQPENSEVSE